MEKLYKKYLNGTCTPGEFTDVLKAMCEDDSKGQMTAPILNLYNENFSADFEDKENSQLLDRIHHRIALEESKTVGKRATLYQNLLKIAAVFIFGLIVTSVLVYTKPEKQIYSSVVETVTTPYGARTNFKLPDGSEVWLNSGSIISFPRQYGDIRQVELTGQAYFKVVKDGKQFMVKTAYGQVEVMGTSFDVKAYSNEVFETTLVSGSVKVKNLTNQMAILKPGQQSSITTTNKFSVNVVNTDMITSWTEGKLIFEKEPFQNVTKALERWYNVRIELRGEKLKKLCYTGTIELETFAEVLELLKATTPIKYTFDKNTRIISIIGK
jgi:ferric-dicitrate binding protein FerR (iron transport regulator)